MHLNGLLLGRLGFAALTLAAGAAGGAVAGRSFQPAPISATPVGGGTGEAAAVQSLRGDLEATKRQLDEARLEVSRLPREERVAALEREIRAQQAFIATLEEKLRTAQASSDDLGRKLSVALEQLAEWRRVVQAIQDDSLRPNIIFPKPKVDAEVQHVDAARNIVILGAGQDDGVEVDWEFAIVRAGEPVAKLRVERILGPKGCGTRIVKVKQGESIRVNDRATTKLVN